MPLAEKGARGKRRQPLSPPQHTEAPERDERSGRGYIIQGTQKNLALAGLYVGETRTKSTTMWRVTHPRIEFLEPWCDFVPGQADAFLRELLSELSVGHPLNGLQLSPLGHSGAADDALFEMEDGRVVQVHLTLSSRPEQLPLPRYRIYSNAVEWAQQVMLPAHEEYGS